MSDRRPAVAVGLVLLVAGFVALLPLMPPSPEDAEAGATVFSADRAWEHIAAIAREPHPVGSPANEAVRDEIVARLQALGLQPELQTVEAPDYYGNPGRVVTVANVMARIEGTAPAGAIALVGHYDSEPTTPGANDNASAVGVMLETARAVLAGAPLDNDLLLLFTDGEEPAPRFGSTAFVMQHPWAADVGFVVNLEAIGEGGPSLLIEAAGPGGWAVDHYTAAAPHPAAFSFLTATAELIGGSNTDFAPFRDAGIPGLEMAYVHGSPIYHTPADTPDRVSRRSLQQHGVNTLALARHLGGVDLAGPEGGGAPVYFTFARSVVVRYPAAWVLPLALLAGAVPVAGAWRRRSGRAVLRGASSVLLGVVSASLVAVLVWMVLAGRRNTLGIAESYAYLAGLVALAVVVGFLVGRWTRREPATRADAAGVAAVWWALALPATLAAPGIGHLLVWPALVGGVTLLLPGGRWWRAGGTAVTGVVALVLLAPAIDVYYQLAQPRPGNPDSELVPFVAIPILLVVLTAELLRSTWMADGQRWWASPPEQGDRPT